MDQNIENRIRERAYEIWEEEGRPEGREAQHWQQAAGDIADAQSENRAASAKSASKTGAKADGTARKKASGDKPATAKAASTKNASGSDKPGKTATGIRKPRAKKTPSS
ncbi:DUF2934 domain-containing protein [Croceicoccus marinus]|jgi:hypothetical protein|uniref:DUF2934 domain-containing protein n=1 Tax=Croceicoccus marinus TaxID=450378 RepID=A0A1Z1FGS5_9SPHN|nr:DUF2934 domain-containing protein [Croceicoccus marinus]ARU18011.1 hypothetical protein A9D14_17030 [Croceicoccus marinus]QNE07515.1 DUF2934 domain-containing protein [Croceicoccus marinus]